MESDKTGKNKIKHSNRHTKRKGVLHMKKNTIICISREYGSGGRAVGELLSEKLGIPFYDKEILSRVAKESDMSEEFVKNHEEQPTATY